MRWAVEFSRDFPATYVSHLDLQRTVMRALKRSGLPVAYSAGFNPHILLSFATAMPVGLVSESEYFEFSTTEDFSKEEVLAALKEAFPSGVTPKSVVNMPDNAKKLAALVTHSSYMLKAPSNFIEQMIEFIEKPSVVIDVFKKGNLKTIDVKDRIISLNRCEDGICLMLKSGQENNLNPIDLTKGLFKTDVAKFNILRKGLYSTVNGKICPLIDAVIG
ncbi:MAG: TIGR03936 family radical SAM-associated protein [Eubacteriales bacterium]